MKDYNNLVEQQQKEFGYLFCQKCTDATDGNWSVWVNPYKLCDHLKATLTDEEIAEARRKYDNRDVGHRDESND